MAVSETTVKFAAAPLKVTLEAPVKLVPVILTLNPGPPPVGSKLLIVGGKATVKLAGLVAVPPNVVTLTGPVVAPAGTVV